MSRIDPDSVGLDRFNDLAPADASALLESCLAVPRWVDEVNAGRPYPTAAAVRAQARTSACELTAEEVDAALTRHPRIGERAGPGHDVDLSGREQAGVDAKDAAARAALAAANRQYEARFGRIFLIRAAGRSSSQILSELQRRLQSSPDAETAEVIAQLAEIAVLRLELLLQGQSEERVAPP